MEFVVLIIVLILRSLLNLLPNRHHDSWFLVLKGKAVTLFKQRAPHLYDVVPEESVENKKNSAHRYSGAGWFSGTGVFVVSVLAPVAVLSILMSVLDDFFWGLPAVAVSVLVLLYSMGRKDSAYWLTRFQIAWRQKDLQGAFQYASEVLPRDAIQDEKQLYQHVFSRLIKIDFQDFFLITFWFMVFGAEGALLARLIILFCEDYIDEVVTPSEQVTTNDKVRTVRYVFEWLPARLVGLSFMLVGHFVCYSQQWLSTLFNRSLTHEALLTQFALGALGEKVEGADNDIFQGIDDAQKDEQLQDLESLLHRSSILWVVCISLFVTLI